jgi:hypothetical protein
MPQVTVPGPIANWETSVTSNTLCGTTHWNVSILRKDTGTADVSDVTVQVASGDRICDLTIGNKRAGSTVNVRVTLTNADPSPAEIRRIMLGRDGNGDIQNIGRVMVTRLRVAGSVTFIEASFLDDAIITGNLGSANMRPSGGVSSAIQNLEVDGNITGSLILQSTVTGAQSSIGLLSVGGQLGDFTTVDLDDNEIAGPDLVSVGGFIERIEAGELNCSIVGPAASRTSVAANNYVPFINQIKVGGEESQTGKISGVIRAARLGDTAATDSYIWSTADFTGLIALGERFTTTYPNAVSRELRFGPLGLKGQVLVNTFVTSQAQWNAPVRVGYQSANEVTISAPNYAVAPAAVGGGRVGLVPYQVYAEASDPPTGTPQIPADTTVDMVFRGQVNYVTNSAVEVRVRPLGSASGTSYSTLFGGSCYTNARLSSGDGLRLTRAADFSVTPPEAVWRVGEYQVTPLATMRSLDSIQTDINLAPGVDTTTPYYFIVVDPCPGDFNRDGQRNTADLTIMLNGFGANLTNSCGHRADMNGDWAVNTADLTNFLGDFGTPCPTARPGQPAAVRYATLPGITSNTPTATQHASALEGDGGGASAATQQQGPTPPGPVIAALGFTSAEAYGVYVSGLTESEFAAHIVLVFSVIKQLGLD